GAREARRPRLAVGIDVPDERDQLASGPRSDRLLAARERRARERAPSVRGRAVRDSVGEGVAATAAAPADQLAAGPGDEPVAVVDAQQRRARQPPPTVRRRVERFADPLPPDEHLLARP